MRNLINHDEMLATVVNAHGWHVKACLPHLVTYTVPDNAAFDLLMSKGGVSLEADACNRLIFVEIEETDDLFQIAANGEIDMNTSSTLLVTSQQINVSRALYDAMGEILNYESGAGLVRLSDSLQLALNENSNCTLTSGATVKDAVNWERWQYWHPEHLERFLQESRQRLEANNPDIWMEFTYNTFDPLIYTDPAEGVLNCDQQITSKYRLVFNGGNPNDLRNYFHLGKNVAFESITT